MRIMIRESIDDVIKSIDIKKLSQEEFVAIVNEIFQLYKEES